MHTPITKVPDQRRDSGPSFPFSVASSDLASGKLVLGAQTTPFSYPESCKGTMGVIRDSDHHVETPVWGVGCNVPPDKPGDQIPFPWDCFPPHFAQVRTYASFDDSRIANVGPLYSPGLACPSDWNPVRMLTRTDGPIPTDWVDNDDLWDVLQAGETYVNCCPRYVDMTHNKVLDWELCAGTNSQSFQRLFMDTECTQSATCSLCLYDQHQNKSYCCVLRKLLLTHCRHRNSQVAFCDRLRDPWCQRQHDCPQRHEVWTDRTSFERYTIHVVFCVIWCSCRNFRWRK